MSYEDTLAGNIGSHQAEGTNPVDEIGEEVRPHLKDAAGETEMSYEDTLAGNIGSHQAEGTNPVDEIGEEVRHHLKDAAGETARNNNSLATEANPSEKEEKTRRVTISVCTSAMQHNVQGLLDYLKTMKTSYPTFIKEVKYHELPYNDIDKYQFSEENPVDVMLLCHSINNRGFSVTDVDDALYGKYLPYCFRVIGKKKMAVIVHDFDAMTQEINEGRMEAFQSRQPTTFSTTTLALICGRLHADVDMTEGDKYKLLNFLKRAALQPEEMKSESAKHEKKGREKLFISAKAKGWTFNVREKLSAAKSATKSMLQGETHSLTNNPEQVRMGSQRRVSISICTSAESSNVNGLLMFLQGLSEDLIREVKFNQLPWNNFKKYKFTPENPVDVMILCHSINNRRFAITDVMDSLYDHYLLNCEKIIGKEKMAVIVHDFDNMNDAVNKARLEAFRRHQPTTFQLTSLAITCGRLASEINILPNDMVRLYEFIQRAAMQPSAMKSLLGRWRGEDQCKE